MSCTERSGRGCQALRGGVPAAEANKPSDLPPCPRRLLLTSHASSHLSSRHRGRLPPQRVSCAVGRCGSTVLVLAGSTCAVPRTQPLVDGAGSQPLPTGICPLLVHLNGKPYCRCLRRAFPLPTQHRPHIPACISTPLRARTEVIKPDPPAPGSASQAAHAYASGDRAEDRSACHGSSAPQASLSTDLAVFRLSARAVGHASTHRWPPTLRGFILTVVPLSVMHVDANHATFRCRR
jgi:hypothetical protein